MGWRVVPAPKAPSRDLPVTGQLKAVVDLLSCAFGLLLVLAGELMVAVWMRIRRTLGGVILVLGVSITAFLIYLAVILTTSSETLALCVAPLSLFGFYWAPAGFWGSNIEAQQLPGAGAGDLKARAVAQG